MKETSENLFTESEKIAYEKMLKVFSISFSMALERIPATRDSKPELFMNKFRDTYNEIMDSFENIDKEEYLAVANIDTNDYDYFCSEFPKMFSRFLSKNFTTQEVNRIFRLQHKKNGMDLITRNGLLTYRIDLNEDNTPTDIVSLHIPITVGLSPNEIKKGFFNDLKCLAKLLKSEELDHITTIRATSWIVTQHKQTFERLGFNCIIRDEEQGKEPPVYTAKLNKEKFIQIFG